VLRPVVFGANDGLVSNLALVMGVAGANPAPGVIVLAGVAGLLAGAFSMAVGEFISVRSQRELLDHQLAFERAQIRDTPDQEREILARVYQGRGFTREEASTFSLQQGGTNGPGILEAGSFLILIVPVAIFFVAQRFFVRGIVVSGVDK
jgi:VIT1/CCC1 family predicted Fe2+/Mn2+ transporter